MVEDGRMRLKSKNKTNPGTSKVPPHNIEVEQAILGAIFMNPDCVIQSKSFLNADDFYKDSHVLIFKAILEVGSDARLIAHRLNQDKKLEHVGGNAYIGELANSVSTSASFKYHTDILKDLSRRRKIIHTCMVAQDQSYDLSKELNDALSTLKTDIREIQAEQKVEYRENKELVNLVFKDIEQRVNDDKHHVGILSGFRAIDSHINGFEPKTLTFVIGRPSMGKTALGVNIADNMALANQGLILFFSLEMGDEQITRRRLSAESEIHLSHIRAGYIQESQWPNLIEAANKVSENNILVIDRAKYKTFENLIPIAETLAHEYKIACIFVDHIQLMNSRKNFNNRHLEISYISNGLKSLAKDLNIPLIVLCQLKRDVESRRNKRPQLSDMKESGDLEQDADIVIGIYREEKDSDIMEIAGLKGRDVGTWQDKLLFNRFIQKIYDPEVP